MALERAELGRFPPIAYIRGDATEPEGIGHKVIVHVCNDVGAWGAGFVMALSRRWKAPEQLYLDGKRQLKLGAVQVVTVEPDVDVSNMIAQRAFPTHKNPCALDYFALHECLRTLACIYGNRDNVSFRMPRIGCGIAGGDWTRVERIVHEALSKAGFPVTVYDLPPASFAPIGRVDYCPDDPSPLTA